MQNTQNTQNIPVMQNTYHIPDIPDMSEDENDILCIICSDTLVCPRIYQKCGHTMCEECMSNSDKLDIKNNKHVFDAVQYRCPLCRSTTLTPWFSRPFNHLVITILEKNEKYRGLEKERIKVRKLDINKRPSISGSKMDMTNMSRLSYNYRDNLAEELYYYILPIIYDATVDGKPYIIIKDRVKELRSVSDIISDKLIKNNNIYRIFSTNTEFTVEIIPLKNSLKYEYVNNNFSENLEYSDSDDVDINIISDDISDDIIPISSITLPVPPNILSDADDIIYASDNIIYTSVNLHI
jgi:hypothetical protein